MLRDPKWLPFPVSRLLQQALHGTCPRCGENRILAGPVRLESDRAKQTLSCLDCRHVWTAFYGSNAGE